MVMTTAAYTLYHTGSIRTQYDGKRKAGILPLLYPPVTPVERCCFDANQGLIVANRRDGHFGQCQRCFDAVENNRFFGRHELFVVSCQMLVIKKSGAYTGYGRRH